MADASFAVLLAGPSGASTLMVLLRMHSYIGFTVWPLPPVGRDHHGPDGDYRDEDDYADDLEPDDDRPEASRLVI